MNQKHLNFESLNAHTYNYMKVIGLHRLFFRIRNPYFATFIGVQALVLIFVSTGCQHLVNQRTKPAINCHDVAAKFETDVVDLEGDVLDDPAIWIHPSDRTLSQVLATNKKAGLHVYDLEGREIQFIPAGRLNNVDVRYDFPFATGTKDIAVASNKSFNALTVFAVDQVSGRWRDVSARTITSGLDEVYGLCMYRSMRSGKFFVIVNSKQGRVEQWELFCSHDSLVDARLVREFSVNGQIEGCVADDETGYLYIAEERFGIWKYYAEPTAPDRRLVADTSTFLSPQIEGLALYKSSAGRGYLIASLQQKNRFAVFERQGVNRYVGCFSIAENGNIDAVANTDGIEITELALGPLFPKGLMVIHDGMNSENGRYAHQNLKYVDWSEIAKSFNPPLITDTSFNYRQLAYPTAEGVCR